MSERKTFFIEDDKQLDDLEAHWCEWGCEAMVTSLVAEVRRLRVRMSELEADVAARDALIEKLSGQSPPRRRERVTCDPAALRAAAGAARADRNEWMYAAHAARGHYEQSDERLARIEAVCRDAESMQWADGSRAYGEGVVAAISWVRAALVDQL